MKKRWKNMGGNMKNMDLLNLADMLRELDLDKNDKETIKEALNFIADKLEEYVGESNE
jgi:hypothetical protein